MNSLGLAHLYQDHIWKLHRLPNIVISDHGHQFASRFMKELNKILGIETNYQWHITHKLMGRQREWTRSWSNIKIQTSTKISPFYANYGFNPWMGIQPHWEVKVQAVERLIEELRKIQGEAEAALHKACDDMKCFADQTHAQAPEYKPRDQVWLSTKILQPSRTLTERQIGPYHYAAYMVGKSSHISYT